MPIRSIRRKARRRVKARTSASLEHGSVIRSACTYKRSHGPTSPARFCECTCRNTKSNGIGKSTPSRYELRSCGHSNDPLDPAERCRLICDTKCNQSHSHSPSRVDMAAAAKYARKTRSQATRFRPTHPMRGRR